MDNTHKRDLPGNTNDTVDARNRASKSSSNSYVTDNNYHELLALGLCSACSKCLRSPNASCPTQNHSTDESYEPTKINNVEKVNLSRVILKPSKRSQGRPFEISIQKNTSDNVKPNEEEKKVKKPVTEESSSYQELLLLGKCDKCEKSVKPYHFSNQGSINVQNVQNKTKPECAEPMDNLSVKPTLHHPITVVASKELETENFKNDAIWERKSLDISIVDPIMVHPITIEVSKELEPENLEDDTISKRENSLDNLSVEPIIDRPIPVNIPTELEPEKLRNDIVSDRKSFDDSAIDTIIDFPNPVKVSTDNELELESLKDDTTSERKSFDNVDVEPTIDRPITIKVSTELEPENIHTLMPITSDVLNNLAPLDAIQIRQPDQIDEELSNLQNSRPSLSEPKLPNPNFPEPNITHDHLEEPHNETLNKSTQTSEDNFYKRRRNTNDSEGRRPHRFSIKKGEGFLDLEYAYPDPDDLEETVSVVTYYETTSASSGEDDVKDESQLQSEIAEKAQEIKWLVTKKSMGLPQAYSEQILRLTEEIITQHTSSTVELTKELFPPKDNKSSKYSSIRDRTSQQAQSMIDIANQSQTILNKLSTTNDHSTGVSGGEATEHLAKMVKKLHCRHQRLKRLAETIVEKRWKLLNMHTSHISKTEYIRKPVSNDKMEYLKNSSKSKIKTMYTNPLAKIRDIGAAGSFRESWEDGDPLWKAVNTVGLREGKKGKCLAPQEEPKSRNNKNLVKTPKNNMSSVFNSHQLMHDLPFLKEQRKLEYHQFESDQMQWPELSIFMSKVNTQLIAFLPSESRLSIFVPHTRIIHGEASTMNFANESTSKMVDDFVDAWKIRTYAIAILIVVLSALLHSAYICGSRMGNNYMTYTMVKALSGMPWLAPTGIYALVFLGYLLGGMAVIKTASAKKHNENVKDYFRNRKGKVRLWYGLVGYFLLVWITRIGLWFSGIHSTEKEMDSIYKRKFYYSEIPSRMLYTQYLFSCCGANGIGDYPEYSQIGWPKSCYDRVENYSSYYVEPKPMDYGCSAVVYKFSATAMSVIFGLCLVIWFLAVIFPMHLYVYELFICMRSRELNPWLLDDKDN